MNPERWRRVQDIFHAAVEQPSPDAAQNFLSAACGDDRELYTDVRRMLEERERSGILDHAAFAPGAPGDGPVFSPGQTIAGRYLVIRYVNRGGMGEVYEAEDHELGERVALKTLLPAIASDARMIERFKQEIALSRKISHTNVCRVFDLVREKAAPDGRDVIFLTMEFLDGQTLTSRLERGGRLTPAEALPLVRQMADALDAAHRAGIVHRDFKPSNVMLAPGPNGTRVVVTDFGLARSFEAGSAASASLSGKVMGTLDYMAPELLTGGAASPVSDVYALGMVVYRMVTGALPFPSDTPLGGVVLRAQAAPPSPRLAVPGLDWRWEHAILRALAPEPARRYTHAGDFADALKADSGAITLPLPQISRRRVGSGVALLALLAAGFIGYKFWERVHSGPPAEAQVLYQKGTEDLRSGADYAAAQALGEAVHLAPGFIQAHVRLAEAWNELDISDRASEQILLARRGDVASLPEADRLRMDAVDWTVTREFAAAAKNYERLASLAGSGDADAEIDLARAYENNDLPAKAIALYRQAAESPAHSPVAWLRLGVLYGRQGDAAQSDRAFDEAERLYQLTSNLEGLTEVAYQRGIALDGRRELAPAAASLNKALETARLAGNSPQEVRTKLQLSVNACLAGDDVAAERYAHEALEAASADQMTSQAVRGILRLGNAYLARHDFDAARRHFEEALALARRDNSDRWAAAARLSLATLHDQLKQPDEQAQEAGAALSYYQPHRFALETSQCLTLLERAQVSRGDYAAALASAQQLLAAAQKRASAPQVVLAHEALGQVYSALEQLPKALDEFRASAAAAPSPESGYYGWENCAAVLARLGRYAESQAALDRAMPGSARYLTLRLYILSDRAEAALSQNRFGEAVALVQQALALDKGHNSADDAGFERILGLALIGTGDLRSGLRHCQAALAAIGNFHDPHQLLVARLSLLEARVRSGDRAQALSLFHELEPALNGLPESRWRALALISRVDSAYVPAARQALEELHKAWGAEWFALYLERPDVRGLERPLGAARVAPTARMRGPLPPTHETAG